MNPKPSSKPKNKYGKKSNSKYRTKSYKKKTPVKGGFVIKRRIPLTSLWGTAVVANQLYFDISGGLATTFITPSTANLAESRVPNMYDIPFSIHFKLSELQNYTELTNISDKYKILSVKLKWNTYGQGAAFGSAYPATYIQYYTDHDDGVAPSISQMNQHMGTKTKNFKTNGSLMMGCRPLVAPIVQNTTAGVAAYAVPNKPMYINCTYPEVPHYSVKGVIRNFNWESGVNYHQQSITIDAEVTVALHDLQ